MKAREMFKKLDFRRSNTDDDLIIYRKDTEVVIIAEDRTSYRNNNMSALPIPNKYMKAIYQQLLENGWLDE
jgi:hypothetical protein